MALGNPRGGFFLHHGQRETYWLNCASLEADQLAWQRGFFFSPTISFPLVHDGAGYGIIRKGGFSILLSITEVAILAGNQPVTGMYKVAEGGHV